MHNVLLNQARQTYLSDSDRQPGILTSGTLYLNDAYLEASEEFFKKKRVLFGSWQSRSNDE